MRRIAVATFASLLALSSCSTMNVKLTAPNTIQPESVSRIVVIPVQFADRALATIPLIDAGIYNQGVKATAEEQRLIMSQSAEEATAFYAKSIKEKTGKDIVISVIKPESVTIDFYKTPASGDILKEVASANEAEMYVAVVSRVRTVGVGAFGIKGNNVLDTSMYLFNKDGTASGSATFTSEAKASGSKNMDVFKEICGMNTQLGSELVKLLF